MKETPGSRIDRLKAVPAEQVIRSAEATQTPTRRAIRADSVQQGSGSQRPDLKPKTTLDFLFKSCEMEFKESLELLDQLRDQGDRLARLKAVPAEQVIPRAEQRVRAWMIIKL